MREAMAPGGLQGRGGHRGPNPRQPLQAKTLSGGAPGRAAPRAAEGLRGAGAGLPVALPAWPKVTQPASRVPNRPGRPCLQAQREERGPDAGRLGRPVRRSGTSRLPRAQPLAASAPEPFWVALRGPGSPGGLAGLPGGPRWPLARDSSPPAPTPRLAPPALAVDGAGRARSPEPMGSARPGPAAAAEEGQLARAWSAGEPQFALLSHPLCLLEPPKRSPGTLLRGPWSHVPRPEDCPPQPTAWASSLTAVCLPAQEEEPVLIWLSQEGPG
ncbi:troponin C, skeletal muscle isoform X1 [Paroedura picta]|uniref:troponin C, skeletal muscle isoform X1 n=1 Tax=Paroedura picta TaxID=143630 RepID=UPI004057BE5C